MFYKKRFKRSTHGRSPIVNNVRNPVPTSNSWQAWLSFVQIQYKKSRIDSLFCSMDKDPRPYLTVSIFGVNFFGLLDSGATQSVIGKSGWEKLRSFNLELETCNNSVKVANGECCTVLGLVSLPIILNSRLKVIKCLIVLDIDAEIIFGIDFWRDMNIVSDFSSSSWKFKNELEDVSSFEIGLTSEERNQQLDILISTFFRKMGSNLGCAKGVKHMIDTGDSAPIKQRYYNVSPYIQKIIDAEIDNMLKLGVIECSNSAWSSPVVMVKKSSGDYRFCVDFRKVNSVTRRDDAYPLPYVNSILDRLRNARFLSSIDIKSAYWQIELEEGSKDKTAFTVPGRGLYQFRRMPFGLHNAAATWQRFVDNILGAELEPSVFVYLDDIIIATADLDSHLLVLEKVFEKLLAAGLTVNRDKCIFMRPELKYLGFVVDKNGLHTDPDKVACMLGYPTPKNVKEVRRFVGMVSWYRRFIPNFATRMAPISKLTRKNQRFLWTSDCEHAFSDIKQCLVKSPILTCPDFTKEFVLQTDASQVGLGCVLTQNFGDEERVISYASRALTPQESKYSVTELECAAVLFGIEKYRCYFEGTRFKVITDHFSLKWLYKLENPSGRLSRWSLRLQGYDFEVIHRKGKSHVVPDALSRAISYVEITEVDQNGWYSKLKQSITSHPDKYPKFKVNNGKIYKFVNFGHPTLYEEDDWKLVVPKTLRKTVLQECHEEPCAGHLGIFKTQKRVANFYFWPGMSADIARYVRACEVCKAQKPEQRLPYGHMSPRLIKRPWEVISTDFIGPLPMSRNKNRFILVVSDLFTKYSLLFPLKAATSSTVVKHLENDVFLIYGVPERIICDNGRQYISNAVKKMVSSYDCKIIYNANYSPHVNPTERVNRVVKTMIRSYVDKDHRSWDVNLGKIGFALRTAVHEVTGCSPAYLNFGREPFISGKMHRVVDQDNELDFGERIEISDHVKDMQKLFGQVKNRLQKTYGEVAERYNLRRRPLVLRVGQVVWKRNYTLSDAAEYYASKLAPKFIKCKVLRRLSTNVYELTEYESGRSLGSWHIKDIKVN